MIKIKILNPIEDRNEPTFRVMVGCTDLLKTYSIEITDSDDYDYLFVGMHDFINKKLPLQDSIDWGLENLYKITDNGDYFLFDGSDSTSLMGSVEVLEQSKAVYLFKNQLLKREEYKKPSYFPSSSRDISIMVKKTISNEKIQSSILEVSSNILFWLELRSNLKFGFDSQFLHDLPWKLFIGAIKKMEQV